MITVLDPSVTVEAGVEKRFLASLRNDSGQDVIAYGVEWAMSTKDGHSPGFTASSDLLLTGSAIRPHAVYPVAAYIGGVPLDQIRSITARVAYYQLADGTIFDTQSTSIETRVREGREASRQILSALLSAISKAKISGASVESAIRDYLDHPSTQNSNAATLVTLELKGVYQHGGAQSLIDYVSRGLSSLANLERLTKH
jgi:hypothetical protein